ncbi:tRNA epoxyqueuosine(34) reductase QueG [Hyphococcus formosus]|uniref:tRNA epoxyqueuosine(34) reductase QueG n=1 Tax=Hyphococcus formosus TaxID=3143534 RepID=UPI00398B50CF
MDTLSQKIRAAAKEAGFDAVGFTSASVPTTLRDRLMHFISLGRHGTMGWIEDRADQRAHPQTLWPEAKSVIMLGMNYGPDNDPLDAIARKSNGTISVYAQNRDYHDLVKKRLKRLARQIVDETGTELKVFVDTAPVMEKPLAARAGVGWQGKHTNLVSREFGSWLFLGAIFMAIDLPSDTPETDHCGSCQNCLDICPTNAFPAPYQLDARRCISYLTIEHPGPIPVEFRKQMGNRIYGCDDCLAVCPWNKFASTASQQAFHARDELRSPALKKLVTLNDSQFRALFSGSPIKRTGRNRFIRNVLIAIGNSGDSSLIDQVQQCLPDESPIVRGAAIWALSQLSIDEFSDAKNQFASTETDASVLAEWNANPV